MSSIICGIDVGAKGAAAILKDGQYLAHFIFNDSKGNFKLLEYIKFLLKYRKVITHVYIEDPASIFGASAKSNFNFGFNKGIQTGVIAAYKLRYTMIQAKAWQKVSWLGIKKITNKVKGKSKGKVVMKDKVDTKATSLVACNRLFPKVNLLATTRSKKPHDGLVDALLIAYYGHKTGDK